MNQIDKLIAELCPDGVPFKALGELGLFIRGTGIQKSDFIESGFGCIHYGEVHTHYGVWATETKSFISREFAKRLKKARQGDLVIATTSEDNEAVAKAVAWLGKDEVAVSTDAFIFRHNLEPIYISYFFQTHFFHSQKRSHVTGTKVRRISDSGLSKIKIPVPPLAVQREIVTLLNSFSELQARKAQYEYYRDQLLTFPDNGQRTTDNGQRTTDNGQLRFRP